MTYTSIFEKLLLIIDIISKSYVYLIFLVFSLIMLVLFILKKISKRKYFILNLAGSMLVLVYIILINSKAVSKVFTSIIDNMFLNIYFPSIYVYLFILLFINISSIISFLNFKGEKVYKTINGISMLITNFNLSMILEIIAKNKVDVFSKESLFTNTNLITLLEFSVNIFIIWLVSLVATYFINVITERILIMKENKVLDKKPANLINNNLEVNVSCLEDEYTKETNPVTNPTVAILPDTYQNKFIPNFTVTTNEIKEEANKFIPLVENNRLDVVNPVVNLNNDNNSFDLSSFIPKKQEVRPISILNDNINSNNISVIDTNKTSSEDILDKILNNNLPFIKEETKIEIPSVDNELKNTYTLNDYRIFNKMLKDIKEHNGSNSVTIDKMLEYRLITKYSSECYDMFKTMLKIYSN